MNKIQCISAVEAREKIVEENLIIVDVRQTSDYNKAHIENAVSLSNSGLADFSGKTDKGHSILVYCYHGINSRSVANYLASQGFKAVYSMNGGFESWRNQQGEG